MLTIVSHLRKEGASAERSTEIANDGEKFKINVVKAVVRSFLWSCWY